jgi:hypothetical protein
VYRIVRGKEATRADFLSDEARGRHLRDRSEGGRRRHRGFSVWTTEDHARRAARRFPRLGAYIAVVDVPEDALLESSRDVPEHLTAYGDPDAFVRSVVAVVRAG